MITVYDELDEAIDTRAQWDLVWDVATEHLTDNELFAWTLYFLGHSMISIGAVIQRQNGKEGVTREYARLLVQSAQRKIFAALDAGDPPPLTEFMPWAKSVEG